MFNRKIAVQFLSVVVVTLFVSQIFFTEIALSKYYIQQKTDFQKAKELFSNGEYESAIKILRKLIDASLLKQKKQKMDTFEMLFRAYYNLGEKSEARNAVGNMLKLDPEYELDATWVPPVERKFFKKIKAKSVNLTIHSTPSDLNVYIDDELQEGKKTPNRYTILDGQRHIVVASPDETKYKSWDEKILFEPGKDQTLNIKLVKKETPSTSQKKPFYKKIWFWTVVGGAVAAITYIAIHPSKEEKVKDLTLPAPPDRPSN